MDVADTAARCAQCRHLDQLLRSPMRESQQWALGSADTSGGRLCFSSMWKYSACKHPPAPSLTEGCSWLPVTVASPHCWYSCLLPTVWLPSPPPCCLCLISCPIPECLSPQAPATPTLLWATADRAQHCRGLRGLRGEAEGKAFQQRRKAWLILHAVRPKWWTRFLGRMEENHPNWNREDLTYFHYY